MNTEQQDKKEEINEENQSITQMQQTSEQSQTSPQVSEESSGRNVLTYSYSTLSDQARCPARVYFKKLAREGKIQTDISLPAVFGSAVHYGIEQRLKREANPFEVARAYLDEELGEAGYVDFASKQYQDKYEVMTVCLNHFEEHFYPNLRKAITDPEHQVELRLETPFRKGVLVGKIDIALPEVFADFKTGKPAQQFELVTNPQAGFYWFLAQECGLQPPKEFVYVYLQGVNLAKKVSKSGKITADRENKMMKFSFPTYPTSEWVEKLFKNQIIPLAKAYEDGVVYKNPSLQNCSTCSYRTVCPDYDLEIVSD